MTTSAVIAKSLGKISLKINKESLCYKYSISYSVSINLLYIYRVYIMMAEDYLIINY